MAFTLNAVDTLSSESRISAPEIHSGFNELHHDNDPRDSRRDHYYNLWVRIQQMVWGQYNPYLRFVRRDSRFRLGIQHDNSWQRLHVRNNNKSSQPGTRSNRDRKRNRHLLYYGIIISILAIGGPARAEEGETNNTSNPVAAATGNVTNQAVQFQNNGAPSRQIIGPNISCNGATMTFSPFYMGNHTTPYDDHMDQQSYTVAENWGGQLNFMVPLDGSLVERCKAAADRQIEKMRLDYELVRALKCAELQQKGFMLMPNSRVWNMCSDVIPIAKWQKAEEKVLASKRACDPPEKPWWKPWHKPKPKCEMTNAKDAIKAAIREETKAKAASKKTTTTTKK